MLKIYLGVLLSFPLATFAQSDLESNVRIKDVKAWVSQTDQTKTCADEYLKRRKQLGLRMALTPVTVAGGLVGGFLVGGTVGRVSYELSNASPDGGWAALGYVVGGAFLGGIAGTGATLTASTISTVNFFNNQRILKALYESQNESGKATRVLHEKYTQIYPDDALSVEDFSAAIADLDASGKLCDGSIVKPSRRKKGRKLKQNLATKKEIFAHIHEQL